MFFHVKETGAAGDSGKLETDPSVLVRKRKPRGSAPLQVTTLIREVPLKDLPFGVC